jgi:hypothetical protein
LGSRFGVGSAGHRQAARRRTQCSSEDLGQGETETSHHHQWTDDDRRSILAEEIKTEIYDGATPYSTYVRGVIIDGDRGVLLTGRHDSALSIEG